MEDRVADGLDDLLHRLVFRCVRAHRVDLHRVGELVAEVPRVDLLLEVVVAERRRSVERIRELKLLVHQLLRVQVQSESNFGVAIRRRVDCIKHTAHDEHLADHLMVHADVHAVRDLQSGFVDFRDDGVIGVGRGVDDPQAVVVGVEVDYVVLSCVQVLTAVEVLQS